MKVYTYYHAGANDPGYPHLIMDRWRASWEANGFECAVLREADAEQHPLFQTLDALVSAMPTVNARFFERACFIRWLAYWTVAPALFTDFDVINYAIKPEDINTKQDMVSYEEDCGVGVIWATRKGIDDFIDLWPKYELYWEHINGKPHVSDMFIFKNAYRGTGKDNLVAEYYGRESMLWAKAVHFGNARCPEGQKFNERWRAMDELARRRKEFNDDLP